MGKGDGGDSGCSCTQSMSVIWLVFFNLIFALLGIGIVVLGFLLRFNSQLFETYILDILTSSEVDGIDLKTIIESVFIVVILVGFIVTIIAGMGVIGGCCKVKMLLTIYSLIMIKLLVLQIVAVIVFVAFRSEIDSRIKGGIRPTLDQCKGYNSTEPLTIGWNYVFSKFDCCGLDSYLDISNTSSWNNRVTYGGSTVTIVTPLFCCKHEGIYPTVTLPTTADSAVSPNTTVSNYVNGCYKAMEDYIMEYRLAMIICGSLVMACEILDIMTACVVRSQITEEAKKNKQRRKGKA